MKKNKKIKENKTTVNNKCDVLGIGSALLDIVVNVDDDFLKNLGLTKGGMSLVDEDQYKKIIDKISKIKSLKTRKFSGGSAANTTIGVSNLGGKSMFVGKVGKDANGKDYKRLLSKKGVNPILSLHDKMTGTVIALITPDGERTMVTYLGAASCLTKEDVLEEHFKKANIVHLEGYAFDLPNMREAALKAMMLAKKNKIAVSFDLSDPGVIRRNYGAIKKAVTDYADIVFANEKEAEEFTGKNAYDAVHHICDECNCAIAVVKLGEKGSIVKSRGKLYKIPICKVNMINTLGAGDAYAAGFLYSISKKMPVETAGRMGAYISAQVVANEQATLGKNISKQAMKFAKGETANKNVVKKDKKTN